MRQSRTRWGEYGQWGTGENGRNQIKTLILFLVLSKELMQIKINANKN